MGGIRIFTFKDIPVFVSPIFFLLIFFYIYTSGSVVVGGIFGGAVFISLLVHEFGHALVARHFKLAPAVILHGWGGLCAHQRAERDRDDALIVAAGPGAGLLVGALTFFVTFLLSSLTPGWQAEHPHLSILLSDLIYINIFWSLLNLLPLWPLDGGQLFRLAMLRILPPVRAERVVYGVGAAIALAGFLWAVSHSYMLLTLIAGMLAWENIQRLNDGRAGGAIRTQNVHKNNMLKEARAALGSGDYREAARVCHQLRAEPSLHQGLLSHVWTILAIATTEMEEYDEALSYIQRAPSDPLVLGAAVRCHAALGNAEAAIAALEHPLFEKIEAEEQVRLKMLVSELTSSQRH